MPPKRSEPTTVTDLHQACLKHAAEVGQAAQKILGVGQMTSTSTHVHDEVGKKAAADIIAGEYRDCVDNAPKRMKEQKDKGAGR